MACTAIALAGCGRNGGESQAQLRDVSIVPEAAGATRMLVSGNGRYLAAELGGEWIRGVFPYPAEPDEVPPVLKVIDLEASNVVATVNGWALGAPGNDGGQLYLAEVGEEYSYRVKSTSDATLAIDVTPPSVGWVPRAALNAGGMPVVMFRSPGFTEPRRLWLAVVDTEQRRIAAQTTLDSPSPLARQRAFDVAVAASPASPIVFVAENAHPSDPWVVRAFSVPDLAQAWRIELPTLDPKQGSFAAVVLAVAGTGDHLFVGQGTGSNEPPRLTTVRVLAASSGEAVAVLDAAELSLGSAAAEAVDVTPIQGGDAVAILFSLRYRTGGGETPDQHVHGIWKLDLGTKKATKVVEVSKDLGKAYESWRDMKTAAIATLPGGRVLVAPPDVTWINKWLGGKLPDGNGLDRGEIRGLVEHPDWHQRGRPRFDARQSALQTAEENDEDAPVVDAGVPPG